MSMHGAMTVPTVTLNREQRDAMGSLVLVELIESQTLDGDDGERAVIAAGRFLEALHWLDDDPERESWEITVDDQITWLTAAVFEPFVRRLAREAVEEYSNDLRWMDDRDAGLSPVRSLIEDELRKYQARISATELFWAA